MSKAKEIIKALNEEEKLDIRLEAKIEAAETLELQDIMEKAEGNSAVEELIANNIEFLIDRELGKGSVSLATAEIGESPEDTLLGTYHVDFKDGTYYDGNFVAEGIHEGETFELNSLSIGSEKLRYFG